MQPNRISSLQRRRLQEARRQQKEVTDTERAKFEDCISQIHSHSLKTEVENLVRTIQREGERLAHFRTQHQLDHYKEKVRDFISKANRSTFKVKATSFTDATGEYSTQLIVEKVDFALEELTKMVLNKESKVISILEQLDLIKGLLTDLYQ